MDAVIRAAFWTARQPIAIHSDMGGARRQLITTLPIMAAISVIRARFVEGPRTNGPAWLTVVATSPIVRLGVVLLEACSSLSNGRHARPSLPSPLLVTAVAQAI